MSGDSVWLAWTGEEEGPAHVFSSQEVAEGYADAVGGWVEEVPLRDRLPPQRTTWWRRYVLNRDDQWEALGGARTHFSYTPPPGLEVLRRDVRTVARHIHSARNPRPGASGAYMVYLVTAVEVSGPDEQEVNRVFDQEVARFRADWGDTDGA